MLKITRVPALAAMALVAIAATMVPSGGHAQGQASPPAAPTASQPVAPPAAPAAPSAAPAPKAAGAVATTEIVDNPYGLEALWKGGDIVARVTLAILAIMSMGSWYIIINKVYEQFRM